MIPDEAVEAAKEAMLSKESGSRAGEDWEDWMTRTARLALEAAAPHLMAAAWDECVASDTAWINPYRKRTNAV